MFGNLYKFRKSHVSKRWLKVHEDYLYYYTESLNHSFTTTKPSLSSGEVSLLTCSATIHYPPLTSISIVKNKIILKTTADTLLTVSTDSLRVSPFGSYQCRVKMQQE